MKISPQWLRDFVDLTVDDRRLAEELTAIGIAVEGISDEGPDTVFEMEIGTNRPDAMNHYGVAREAAALYGVDLKPIETSAAKAATSKASIGTTEVVPARASPSQRATSSLAPSSAKLGKGTPFGETSFAIEIEAKEGCARYTAQIVRGVRIKVSPEEIASRLALVAQRPINNAADASNYTLWEMGHPTHAFDLDLLEGGKIIVRRARGGETLKTLDGIDRKLSQEDLIISDAHKPVALAGVMGGFDTMITEKTKNILIESAWFDPVAVRLETHEIVAILKRLGFELVPEPGAPPEFSVRIPTWRLDVEREIDLIEEIARLHGYNKFSNTLPAFAGAVVEAPNAAKEARLRSYLLALGHHEAVSLSFISHEDAETFSSAPVIELANPLSEEASLMRSSLVPGMLNMLAYNLNRGTENVRLFEMGDVYEASGASTLEHRRICLGATAGALRHDIPQGQILDKSRGTSELETFRSFKGDIENLLRGFDHESLEFDRQAADYYQPDRSARAMIDGELIAQFGELNSEIAVSRKLREQVFVAEIFADRLYQHSLRAILYRPLPRFPGVERDFSFLFEDDVTFDKIEPPVHSLALPELRSFVPIEIFRGGSVPAGKYSVLLRAKFQSMERTLREDEVAEWSAKIVSALNDLGGTQRA